MELAPRFAPMVQRAYGSISNDAEELRFEYIPSIRHDFTVELAKSSTRERSYRSTLVGPHRDELQLLVDDRSAAQYGSEGQKRTLAIALKMAQAEYLTEVHGTPPVLLIDDIMGELDIKRRSGFLPLLQRAQLWKDVHRWRVKEGTIAKC